MKSALVGLERVEIVALEQSERLQGDETLRPRARLHHRVAAIVVTYRRLDTRLPAGHVLAGQHAAMALPRSVHNLLRAAEAIDRFGDEALRPRLARALDLGLAAAAAALRLAQDTVVSRSHLRIGEHGAGRRHLAVAQIDRRRGRPVIAELVFDHVDGGAYALDQRIAVLSIADRRRQHIGNAHGAVVAQQRHPGVERAWDAGGEQSGAGHKVEAQFVAVILDGGAGGRRPLPADHFGLAAPDIVQDHGHITARTIKMRLDHLQGERGRDRGVEGVAALFQDAHADGCRDPVRRGDDAEGALDFGPGCEGIGIDLGGAGAHGRLLLSLIRHSGARRRREPEIQPRMQRLSLDSGFARCASAPE